MVCLEGAKTPEGFIVLTAGAPVDTLFDDPRTGTNPDPPASILSPKPINKPTFSVELGAVKTTNHNASSISVVDNVEPIRPYNSDFFTFYFFDNRVDINSFISYFNDYSDADTDTGHKGSYLLSIKNINHMKRYI